MGIKIDESLFCLVDVQEKLFQHMYNKDKLETNLIKLINGLKILNIPIIINEQYKKGLGETILSLRSMFDNFKSFEKSTFSFYKNRETFDEIKRSNKKVIIVAGIETHVCVLQSCIDLIQDGYKVVLVTNCCGSRKENDEKIAIKRLIQAGVIPTTYESLLFELTIDTKNDYFKTISSIIK